MVGDRLPCAAAEGDRSTSVLENSVVVVVGLPRSRRRIRRRRSRNVTLYVCDVRACVCAYGELDIFFVFLCQCSFASPRVCLSADLQPKDGYLYFF